MHSINLVYNNNAILRADCATYLEISLDSRLTWTKHIAKVIENTTSRLSVLKRIASVKWGSSQSVLTSTFTSYIRPVINYGSELLVTASDSALSKLDTVQNKALRFITGAATSTTIASMELQTEMSSSSERLQYSALSLGELLLRKKHFWPKYIPSQTRLNTQHTFLFELHRLSNVFGVSDNIIPLFRPTILSDNLRYASANLDLVLPVHKRISLLAELRSVVLATILESIQIKIGYTYLLMALLQLPLVGLGELVLSLTFLILKNLLVPGHTILMTVSGYNLFPSKLEFECKQLINSFLFTGRDVVLQWIPSHCRIHGNEQADKLAKEASMLHPSCLPMHLRNVKRLLRDQLRQKRISTLTGLAVGKSWFCRLDGQICAQLSALPRVEGVACFRIITGHDYLQAHLFKIGLADSPLCPLCKSVQMTGEPLSDCPVLFHDLYRKTTVEFSFLIE
ncbi:uncharacterized protein LOC103524116 [Trichonephila clavipes]|nr:uncharacterized protein LOC103524116 [Trichonephila clavipes]